MVKGNMSKLTGGIVYSELEKNISNTCTARRYSTTFPRLPINSKNIIRIRVCFAKGLAKGKLGGAC